MSKQKLRKVYWLNDGRKKASRTHLAEYGKSTTLCNIWFGKSAIFDMEFRRMCMICTWHANGKPETHLSEYYK